MILRDVTGDFLYVPIHKRRCQECLASLIGSAVNQDGRSASMHGPSTCGPVWPDGVEQHCGTIFTWDMRYLVILGNSLHDFQ